MNKLAIVHFQPLELYPPVQNLLQFLQTRHTENELYIFTTATDKNIRPFKSPGQKFNIIQLGKSGNNIPLLKRYYYYLQFYLGCLFKLIRLKPAKILYYETISSFPVFIYKKYFNSKAEVFIHYHEYTSPGEFDKGMKLVSQFHKKEKYLYPKASWVSHTNKYRMQQFVADSEPVVINNQHILPNYPPKNWFIQPLTGIEMPVKIIYVGALSLNTMYTIEFAEWVIQQNGKVVWDIYSLNITDDAKDYLNSFASSWINIQPGVEYYDLPVIIKKYAVGVVLYNGHIPNYIDNAPNKLFEYLACGLDVWFPVVMKGSLPYITKGSFPKVMAIDFTKMQNFSLVDAVDRNGYIYKPTSFFCEEALEDIANRFFTK